MPIKGFKSLLFIVMDGCRQLCGSFLRHYIFGRSCLRAGCFLDTGRNTPEFVASLRERVINQAESGTVRTLTEFILVDLELFRNFSWFIRIVQTVTVTVYDKK
jgi:hypothetical protein